MHIAPSTISIYLCRMCPAPIRVERAPPEREPNKTKAERHDRSRSEGNEGRGGQCAQCREAAQPPCEPSRLVIGATLRRAGAGRTDLTSHSGALAAHPHCPAHRVNLDPREGSTQRSTDVGVAAEGCTDQARPALVSSVRLQGCRTCTGTRIHCQSFPCLPSPLIRPSARSTRRGRLGADETNRQRDHRQMRR
jgi:hypothetical protein